MATLADASSANSGFPVEVAVQRICCQHRNIARVFRAHESHANAIATASRAPDFILIRAILHYIDIFSYGVHHPAEEKFLFSAMRQSGAPGQVIDNAVLAHRSGAEKFVVLQSAFEAWSNQPGMHNPPFLELAPGYISFEFDHMAYEESVVLPCALDNLLADDWEPIAEAFRSHDDPLFGIRPAPELASLYHLVVGRPVLH